MKALACVGMGKMEVDVLNGFRTAGLMIDEVSAEGVTKLKLEEEEYLFVFSANFSPEVSRVCQEARIPYFCYIMELPQRQIYHPAMKNPCNFVFCFDCAVSQELERIIPQRSFHLPLGAGEISHPECGGDEKKAEVSFVGSLCEHSWGNEVYEQIEDVSGYVQGYLESLLKSQVRIYGYNLLKEALDNKVFQEIKKKLSQEVLSWASEEREKDLFANVILADKATQMGRIQILQAVSGQFDTHIYTEDNDSKQRLAAHVHNQVLTPAECVQVYQNSKINLCLPHRSIVSGIPQEVFSIMAAGGFVLMNFQPEIPENFVIGEHLDVFMNEEEMLEKIAYYLEHEEERIQIAKAGQQAVKELHTYFSRAVTMFNTVFSDET